MQSGCFKLEEGCGERLRHKYVDSELLVNELDDHNLKIWKATIGGNNSELLVNELGASNLQAVQLTLLACILYYRRPRWPDQLGERGRETVSKIRRSGGSAPRD